MEEEEEGRGGEEKTEEREWRKTLTDWLYLFASETHTI